MSKKKKKLRLLTAVVGKATVGVLWFFLIIIGISLLPFPGNYKMFSVMSGSMEPTISKGDVIVTKEQKDYRKGDVITWRELGSRVTVTHRVVSVEEKKGKKYFVTKGDANNSPDGERVPKERIIGRAIFVVPFFGFLLSAVKSPQGLIGLVIIPGLFFIFLEMTKIKEEIGKIIRKRRK